MMNEIPVSSYSQPQRLSFPEDEIRHDWLPILLDAYLIIDQGVSEAIQREQQQGRELACSRGCSSCCTTHQDIPVYPLELVGMTWYVVEKLESPLREQVKQNLRDIDQVKGCPFLIDHACSIHPMRPVACRQFNVLDKPCAEGEDAFHTRKEDVLVPIKSYTDRAFDTMLPFYGVQDKEKRREVIEQGALHALAKVMRELSWQTVPDKMQAFDERK